MVTVVISAFNEERDLSGTLKKVISAADAAGRIPIEIIIINDGSRDKTREVIEGFERKFSFIRSIHYLQNRGIGAGIRDAIHIAKYDKLCQFPGDNACSFHIMKTLFESAYQADFVVSYIVNVEHRGYKRQMISALYSFIYALTFNLPLRYLNGAPMYPVPLLKKLRLKSTRYSILAEAAVKLLRKPITFFEIPDYIKPVQLNSASLHWINFKEVVSTYCRLIYEIFFRYRSEFRGKPVRIIPDFDTVPEILSCHHSDVSQGISDFEEINNEPSL